MTATAGWPILAHSKLALCIFMKFLQYASYDRNDDFKNDTRVVPDVRYPNVMSAFVIQLYHTVGAGHFVDGPLYDSTAFAMAWEVLMWETYLLLSAHPSFWLLLYAMDTGKFSFSTLSGVALVVCDCQNILVSSPLLYEVQFLLVPPSWTSVSGTLAENKLILYKFPVLEIILDMPVLVTA